MESTLDPMVLGPLMIIITVLWFGGFSWAGMREDQTPKGPTRPLSPGEPGPWWTNDGFDSSPKPIPVRVQRGNPSH
ncbi:hypothetical protein [Pedococcus sp. 5OH_020]|uniref:hypothetical protein n=1 Tax=Pedococcus sp. 5OH_020 TaxID=2989814 RepID=UPI0022E9A070|nr:hypothetical protein [Pedococcus sp. 5OH_020]